MMKHFNNERPRFASYGFWCEKWEPRTMPRADQHDEIELNYLTEGSLTYLMGGRRVQVPARRLAVFWATVPHQIIDFENESPYFVATIPFAWFLKWRVPAPLQTRILKWDLVIDLAPVDVARDQSRFEQWIDDTEEGTLSSSAALEIQARLLRMAHYLPCESQDLEHEATVQMESQDKAERMARIISNGYEEKLTIPQIAAEVDLHPDYAATLFKRTFGSTIVSFITRHRVAHAQRLLLSTEDPIIRIAWESGFDSLSRFNRAFKQATGLTPRDYRKTRR